MGGLLFAFRQKAKLEIFSLQPKVLKMQAVGLSTGELFTYGFFVPTASYII